MAELKARITVDIPQDEVGSVFGRYQQVSLGCATPEFGLIPSFVYTSSTRKILCHRQEGSSPH